MPSYIFTTVPAKLKITLPKAEFQPGDLVMIAKVTQVEMDQFKFNLQRKQDLTIIKSFQAEVDYTS